MLTELLQAVDCLRKGQIIAYPTEAVFGLGCDPFNKLAVYQLLQLKQRSISKGFILVAAYWDQLKPLIAVESVPAPALLQAKMTWPGPVTWVFPASAKVPAWIRGNHLGIAVRVSLHPVVRELCQEFGGPIVSSSANREGELPAKNYQTVEVIFGEQLGAIVRGTVGPLANPTPIRDVMSGEILRLC